MNQPIVVVTGNPEVDTRLNRMIRKALLYRELEALCLCIEFYGVAQALGLIKHPGSSAQV